MTSQCEALFRDDPYARSCEARVIGVNDRGGILLDRTVFYATSGGQPGDAGQLKPADGASVTVATTVYGQSPSEIVHVPTEPADLPAGAPVEAILDWDRRHRHMRMHTALHLLCSLVPYPVTGGSIGADESRLDFDIEAVDAVDRDDLTARLNALIREDHGVTTRWITDAALADNPDLVRTMSVKPPTGSGEVRLVSIGEGGAIDLQPCGGTHVRSTGEIGEVHVSKIEKKGRQNRRIRVRLGSAQ